MLIHSSAAIGPDSRPDGAWITTSPLIRLSPDQRCARTASRWYRLREPFALRPATTH